MKWERGELLYEGKAKRLYATQDADYLIAEFKDSLTAFNGGMKAELTSKGEWNNRISAAILGFLNGKGVKTHFVEELSPREQVVKNLKMVPLEAVVRNVIAGSVSKRTGLAEGTALGRPVLEYHWKRDDLNDPLLTEDLIIALGIADDDHLADFRKAALHVNEVLGPYMDERGILLVDFKLEFGYFRDSELTVGDEISPDTCRFWNKDDRTKLDKDRFRRKLGNVAEAYQQVLERVTRP
ncbi:MAG: phosphoribosylaminoimidazolesuccinocarboxamide synthase [Candidatus Riflebacteria bacterium RBG_13_59_9]|nr:MAG: phosphoribosylaminoimidazolesuccinocarboxamide synthase [Candidatus Riflebacteria bacterium RBG_13_59_9]